jgi:hypothetical protein
MKIPFSSISNEQVKLLERMTALYSKKLDEKIAEKYGEYCSRFIEDVRRVDKGGVVPVGWSVYKFGVDPLRDGGTACKIYTCYADNVL